MGDTRTAPSCRRWRWVRPFGSCNKRTPEWSDLATGKWMGAGERCSQHIEDEEGHVPGHLLRRHGSFCPRGAMSLVYASGALGAGARGSEICPRTAIIATDFSTAPMSGTFAGSLILSAMFQTCSGDESAGDLCGPLVRPYTADATPQLYPTTPHRRSVQPLFCDPKPRLDTATPYRGSMPRLRCA